MLPTSRTTRNTTWTGFRAESSGRTLCGDPARALRLRPARRLRPRFSGAGNSGSCSGSELPRVLPRVLPRAWPRLEPLPLVISITYPLISVHASNIRRYFRNRRRRGQHRTSLTRGTDRIDGSGTPPDPHAAAKVAKRAAWSLAKHGRTRSLRYSALSDRHGASPVSSQRCPDRLNRIVTTDLQAPSVVPLPIG